jgi:hypothetical protein
MTIISKLRQQLKIADMHTNCPAVTKTITATATILSTATEAGATIGLAAYAHAPE